MAVTTNLLEILKVDMSFQSLEAFSTNNLTYVLCIRKHNHAF